MARQPCDQTIHILEPFDRRGTILPAPALDLTRDIVLDTTEISEAKRRWIEAVQPRQRRVDRVIDGGPHDRSPIRNIRFPENAALDVVHQVERRADDTRVIAIVERPRDRKAPRGKRRDDTEFAIDRMGRRQQLAGWLAPEDIAA